MITSRWSVFLYAIMLSFFAVIFGYIVTTKMTTLIENLDFQDYDLKLHSNITEKAGLAIDYNTLLNKNGSGFTNTIVCPDIVTLSGTTSGGARTDISTSPFFNGTEFACSGSTVWGNLLLSYSSGGNIFSTGSYLWSEITLLPIDGTGARSGTFTDMSGTYISFVASGAMSGIDLNKNSDDFKASSIWNTPYPLNMSDDDDIARKVSYGYVKKNTGWHSVFLMNTPIRKYITNNTFNVGSQAKTPSETQTGYLRIDIDNPYNIKIVEFDKTRFEQTKEFLVTNNTGASFTQGWIGWITNALSLSGTKSNAKAFNLKDKDYAVFLSFTGNLSNTGIEFLKYKITMENEYGSGIYITPLNESENGIARYLWADIIIDEDNDYRYKEFEIVRENTVPLNMGNVIRWCVYGMTFWTGCALY